MTRPATVIMSLHCCNCVFLY